MKKSGHISEKEEFNRTDVYLSNFEERKFYYSKLSFTPNNVSHFANFERKKATAGAAHCTGIGVRSYETNFEVLLYDRNHNLIPILIFVA